jgi:hypothetical protein
VLGIILDYEAGVYENNIRLMYGGEFKKILIQRWFIFSTVPLSI